MGEIMKEVRNELIGIRLNETEKKLISEAAIKDCRTVSQWCLLRLLKIAGEELK